MRYLISHAAEVTSLGGQHLLIAVTALGIALCIALPVGVFVAPRPRVGGALLGFFGAIYAIPSLALFGVLVLFEGLGFWTAVTALAAYAQMILLRNIVAGLRGVDAAAVEAARGSGMTNAQLLWRVSAPLAMPAVLAGMRVAAVSIIGIATVAAWVGAGGLGTLIFAGIDQQNYDKALAGAIGAMVLAIAVDALLRFAERRARRSAL
jgi:osmoprotectant transport system permease protein